MIIHLKYEKPHQLFHREYQLLLQGWLHFLKDFSFTISLNPI